MPWINLATETNGACKVCCFAHSDSFIKGQDNKPLFFQRDGVEEIFNSDYVTEVRRKMLAGEEVRDCAYCNEQRSKGLAPVQDQFNSTYFDEDFAAKLEYSRKNAGKVAGVPALLDVRSGNLCNLKCNSCWSLSSSRLYQEHREGAEGKIEGLPPFLKNLWTKQLATAEGNDFNWTQSKRYIENVRLCGASLKRVYFAGGEPMLQPLVKETLEELLNLGRRDLTIALNTNLTHLDEEFLALLGEFARVEISGSIDGFGGATEYLRFPSKWPVVSENLRTLQRRFGGVSISYLVQLANVFSLVKLVRWLESEELLRSVPIYPNFLHGPEYLRVDHLPASLRSEAYAVLESACGDGQLGEQHRNALRQVMIQLKAPMHPESTMRLKQFRQYTEFMDKRRGLNFREAFPKMGSLL